MTDEERLHQYQDLLDAGVITQAEFDEMTIHLRERVRTDLAQTSADETPTVESKTAVTKNSSTNETDGDLESSIMPTASETTINTPDNKVDDIEEDVVTEAVNKEQTTLVAGQEQQTPEHQQQKHRYDMVIAVAVVLIVLIGGGFIVVRHNQQNAQIGNEKTKRSSTKAVASSKKTTSKKDHQKPASRHKKKTTAKVAAQWSTNQTKELAAYMDIWQNAVGQTYVGTYNGNTPQHLAYKFPAALQKGQLDGHLKLDNHDVKFTWSPKADKKADYQVVAVATGSRQGSSGPTTYFFVIHDGQGIVYGTETASGDDLELAQTQNADLQNNFASIVNESSSSSADSESQTDITLNDGTTVSES